MKQVLYFSAKWCTACQSTTPLIEQLKRSGTAQVASVKTESYKADFEKKEDFSALFDYSGKTIPVQILSLGISLGQPTLITLD